MKHRNAIAAIGLLVSAAPLSAGQLHGTTLDREDLGLSSRIEDMTAQMPGDTNRVTGTVTAIDRATGMIALQTDAGDMRLQFAPEQIRGLHQGSQVTADLAMAPAIAAGDAPADHPGSEFTVTGRIGTIDRDNGFISLDTKDGPLKLRFPPTTLRGIEAGDRITVGLTLRQ
ncbi:MAG TPA: hypothetical protein VEB21_08570 [Terriglobales bacterium]|nr:hypothetical protein [Terriglobales bacterium]